MSTQQVAERPVVTEDDLRRKTEEARRRLGLAPSPPSAEIRPAAADGSTSDGPAAEPVTCARCGDTFAAPTLRIGFLGRPLPLRRICEQCVEVERAEREERERREYEEWRARRRQAREASIVETLHRAGVNVWEHGRCTLESYDASESGPGPVEAVREWLAEVRQAGQYDPVRGLYLFGGTGAGKTHLAVAAARELLLDPGFPQDGVVFDYALRLIVEIQDTYATRESTEEVLERRIKARVWILDDLGTEAPSDDVVRRLTLIFSERAGRPTLVTSNLAPDQLEARHPELYRVASRLGPAYFRAVLVQGRDRRFDLPPRGVA